MYMSTYFIQGVLIGQFEKDLTCEWGCPENRGQPFEKCTPKIENTLDKKSNYSGY